MKKFLVSICLLFSVFTVAVYAETEQDGINKVLSMFRTYEYKGYRERKGVKAKDELWKSYTYLVYDYNDKPWEFYLHIHNFNKKSFQYILELEVYAIHDNIPDWDIVVYSPQNSPYYQSQEFINKINANPRIALNTTKSSPQLSTQSRSQSSSTTVAIPSGTLYELYDWNNSYKNPTIITDCINSIDVRNIKDNDIILITNLTLTQPGNNLIMFQDRHGHELYEDLYGRNDTVFYFLPRTGHPDWWDVRLSECANGKWDKYTQSYGKPTPISVYAKIKRDSKDDYLELLGFILPN